MLVRVFAERPDDATITTLVQTEHWPTCTRPKHDYYVEYNIFGANQYPQKAVSHLTYPVSPQAIWGDFLP
jgi:hypothetical protein